MLVECPAGACVIAPSRLPIAPEAKGQLGKLNGAEATAARGQSYTKWDINHIFVDFWRHRSYNESKVIFFTFAEGAKGNARSADQRTEMTRSGCRGTQNRADEAPRERPVGWRGPMRH